MLLRDRAGPFLPAKIRPLAIACTDAVPEVQNDRQFLGGLTADAALARIVLVGKHGAHQEDRNDAAVRGVRVRFLWSELLWLLLGVPALVGAYVMLLYRSAHAAQYSSVALVREAMSGALRVRRHLPPCVLLLAVIALLLATARPAADLTSLTEQRTIVLAIDVSMSMSATDIAPSRLEAAQAAANAFVSSLPRDVRVAIVSFAGNADVLQIPTRNRQYLADAIRSLHLDYNTAIGTGIMAALITLFPDEGIGDSYDIFGRAGWRDGGRETPPTGKANPPAAAPAPVPAGSYGPGAVILMTDGKSVAGLDPRVAARMAAARGVRVYTVGFGTPGAFFVADDEEPAERFDEETLKTIARITRGQYFHADSVQGLSDVYRQLSPEVVLERTRETEITAAFTAAAALLLLLSATLSMMWFGRVA